MSFLAEQACQYLSCPDDHGPLRYEPQRYCCAACGRTFPVHLGRVAELLPKEPSQAPGLSASPYYAAYRAAFSRPFVPDDSALAWGAEETFSSAWVRKRRRQVELVQRLLAEAPGDPDRVVCDFSGGAGYYTFALARTFPTVFHCDLSVDSLNYCLFKAQSAALDNIFFVRMDYLQPPFQATLDRVISTDSLVGGPNHEMQVLANIRAGLRPGGMALVDFHNWWHNPLRRLGLLKQNYGRNRSYSRREAERLLAECGIREFRYTPFHQEALRLLDLIIPPTRLMYSFGGLA
jgi:SAM-dependent methyltransferase/uncharacterized protein YbaR (Trm112 family)